MPVPVTLPSQVITALQSAGWTITDQHIVFKRSSFYSFIDLEARKLNEKPVIQAKRVTDVPETNDPGHSGISTFSVVGLDVQNVLKSASSVGRE